MVAARVSSRVFAVILAGGQGSRLGGLTRSRCKPALPFGGRYRSIDFTLSNCVNSGITRIGVAAQYQAQSLMQHIQQSWSFLNRERGEFVEFWTAEERRDARRYAGTADAVYQNLVAINRYGPQYVLVLAADHVYRMDYSALLSFHRDNRAGVTVACQPVPSEQARHFGVMSVERDEITAFREKPLSVAGGSHVLASMGVYVFNADLLSALLVDDAVRADSTHDFGRDLIPACVRAPGVRACAHRFRDPCTGGAGYWRDIGTVDAYWSANMDLLERDRGIDPTDSRWPIRSAPDTSLPTQALPERHGVATIISNAVVAEGCRIEGATVRRSVLFSGVSVGTGSVVEDSILLPGVRVGADCRIHHAVVDECVEVPRGTSLLHNPTSAAYSCEVSPGGVTVLSRRNDEPRLNAAATANWQRRPGIPGGASCAEQPARHSRGLMIAHHSVQ
jgi:glucose-1-phosphate adenylyltransferase